MYTSHGHQIVGTPVEGDEPESVARCGGPSLCYKCGIEAAQARNRQKAKESILTVNEAKGLVMGFKKYKRKPFEVEAVEITEENIDELAQYIGTVRVREEDQVKFIQVDRRLIPNVARVYQGFYMTKMGDNIRCYSPRTFKEQFELVEE